jgi:pimeloyl-ACP methyl ester carboxylesterase
VTIDEAVVRRAAELARADGEFRLASAAWAGTLVLAVEGGAAWRVPVSHGSVGPVTPAALTSGGAEGAGPTETLVAGPSLFGSARVDPRPADANVHNAIRRLTELLRHAANGTDPAPVAASNISRHGAHDDAIGRYIHLDLGGVDHRVYYEAAGAGIGLLCQHTAGADGRQWRHLLEDERVTDRFRVIVYDLPYHGKSLPPESKAWWAEEYRLTTASAMELPVTLARTVGLERPVFIGSSIGGHLALDLGAYHPDDFRAVISLEGALKMDRNEAVFPTGPDLRDPARHAALMMTLMAPQAPERFRQETRLHYAQGAPGVFPGDTYYYFTDHDLRNETGRFDTARCPVYLLTGEYDAATAVRTLEAAQQIAGAKAQIMKGLGHFPMSEDYDQLMEYLLPVLDEVATLP